MPLYTITIKTKMREYILDNILQIKGWTSLINFFCYFPGILLAALITFIGSEEHVESLFVIMILVNFHSTVFLRA